MPFQLSTSGRFPSRPTATHAVAEVHDTPLNQEGDPPPPPPPPGQGEPPHGKDGRAGTAAFVNDQPLPVQRPTSGKSPSRSNALPASVHADAEEHATAFTDDTPSGARFAGAVAMNCCVGVIAQRLPFHCSARAASGCSKGEPPTAAQPVGE
jgi:hypothetical protein